MNIPDEAWSAVVAALPMDRVIRAANAEGNRAWHVCELANDAVKAAAPLIVAAELERLADWWWGESPGIDPIVRDLRKRAAELRNEVSDA